MKRFFVMFVLALVGSALLVGTVGAAGDTKGPKCANFVFGDAGYGYDASTNTGTVEVTMTLAAPACDQATYSLDVYNLQGTGEPITQLVGTASGNTVTYSGTFSPAPSDGVCLVATSNIGPHQADRAPDTGCFPVKAGEPPGNQGFS